MWIRVLTMGPVGIIQSVADILIVAYLFYRIFLLIRGTRAVQLVKGVVILLLATQAAKLLNLEATYRVLQTAQIALLVALPIVFQPELRRLLESLGRGGLFRSGSADATRSLLEEIRRALAQLSARRVGALVVIERETGLRELSERGVALDARVSAQLLVTLFQPGTPLHDGATVIRGARIASAGVFLPLAEADLPRDLGTRHRAAVGVTEHSDAVAIVVSEETGTISLATQGRIVRPLSPEGAVDLLGGLLRPAAAEVAGFFQRKET